MESMYRDRTPPVLQMFDNRPETRIERATTKARNLGGSGPFRWWRGSDLNRRPSGYEHAGTTSADLGKHAKSLVNGL